MGSSWPWTRTTTAFLLVLALLSLSEGPAFCSARRHDCLRVDFGKDSNSSAMARPPASWRSARGGRDRDTMRMPFCGGSFWVSLNTTQLLEDVACPHAPAPGPAPNKRIGHGGGDRRGVCTSRWKGDGYEVIVNDFKDLRKRACSNWVEAPTRTSRRERVLVCAECPADKKKMSPGPGRRGLLAFAVTITIVISF